MKLTQWSQVLLATSLLGAGACASTGSDDSPEEQAAKKISLVASPSTVHLTSSGTSSFTLTLKGTKSNETLNLTSPPDGIEEGTSIFITGGEPEVVGVSAGPGLATGTAGTQTFSVQVGKTTYSAKVTFVIDGGPTVDGGAPPVDGGPVIDGGAPPVDGGGDTGVTVTIVPSTVTVAPGGHGKFEVVEAGGSSANELVFASINWGQVPPVVSEDTSLLVAINSETDCDYQVDSDAADATYVQTIDVSVPATDTTKATTVHTGVTFVVKK